MLANLRLHKRFHKFPVETRRTPGTGEQGIKLGLDYFTRGAVTRYPADCLQRSDVSIRGANKNASLTDIEKSLGTA